MRSQKPFFEDHLTASCIDKTAEIGGRLLLYCGAGVTIDRTGHSWGALVRSLLPQRLHKNRPSMPTRAQVDNLTGDAPERLASSVIYLLREASGGGEKLQRKLRTRLRELLYGTQSQWQAGTLVEEIVTLAVIRSAFRRETMLLTTNYDTFIESALERSLANLPEGLPRPGVRVYLAGEVLVRTVEPSGIDKDRPGAYVDIVYLHGRLPPSHEGKVSWPLVLDENSYASSAAQVEQTIEHALGKASFALMLGTSLRDTPLIRALSMTRNDGCERVAMLLRADFAHETDDDERLAVRLAQHRASELGVVPLFPDFPVQVGQLITEIILRMAHPAFPDGDPRSLPYTQRLDSWWGDWARAHAEDVTLNDKLRLVLAQAYEISDLNIPDSPASPMQERLQIELWVREGPTAELRTLRRWGRATDMTPDGLAGKVTDLGHNSYLAPVRAFVEGRPLLLDVESLEDGRHEIAQYTWKSFLCIPIRVRGVFVGVISLASDTELTATVISSSADLTSNLVERLRLEGNSLLGG